MAILVIKKDGNVSVMWRAGVDEAVATVGLWPQSMRDQIAELRPVEDSELPDRASLDRWRWHDGQLIVLPAVDVPAVSSPSAEPVTVATPDPRVDELKAELAAQRTMIAELVSALKEATK